MLADGYGYLRVRGDTVFTRRHADIFDFKNQLRDFLKQPENGIYAPHYEVLRNSQNPCYTLVCVRQKGNCDKEMLSIL